MNKKILIVLADYYKDISNGLLKSALKNIPRSNRTKIITLEILEQKLGKLVNWEN